MGPARKYWLEMRTGSREETGERVLTTAVEPAQVAKQFLLGRQEKALAEEVVLPRTLVRVRVRPAEGSEANRVGEEAP